MTNKTPVEKRLLSDLEAIETALRTLSKESNPEGWANMMNLKGITLMDMKKFKEADATFGEALRIADDAVKCKIYINFAKNCFFSKNMEQALKFLADAFKLLKINTRFQNNFIMGHAHMLRGQVYYRAKSDKKALTEFKMAEHFLERNADLMGVGLSCMEIARIHINNKNMSTAWNYLKKSENCFRNFGEDEAMGVSVCKAIALLHDSKPEEAQELMKKAYEKSNEFGMAKYVIYDILDAYLDIRTQSPEFAVHIT